jgi:Asp-tRNA(Asn)/Glu-tRNA(Gln) amidotransferase A subunit family amidase
MSSELEVAIQTTTRRRFVAYFSGAGLGSTLLPGTLWAHMQRQEAPEVTADMVREAAWISGLDITEDQAEEMAEGVNRNLRGQAELFEHRLDNSVAPPIYFSPVVPGLDIDRTERPFRTSATDGVRRPSHLEEVAFWPLTSLGELIRSRQVTSLELTEMYLGRLKRYNPTYNNVVTFTDDLAREEARRADAEIAAGHYRGPLHGLPWGAKDILGVHGYPTTWGSDAFKDQVTEYEATVVRLLREAGAVLLAKLTTGELAGGDRWFGGRTRNPWNPDYGSSGSSAGPGSATVAGCVAFSIGTETSGSILSPSIACGATGLRPTYGRVSRFGAMTLRWTGDRLGPICRHVEDCAIVFKAIAQPDEDDPSVVDIPFNWDAGLDATRLRVAYFPEAFDDDESKGEDWRANDRRALDQIRSLGIELHPLDVPLRDFSTDGLRALGVESSTAFDAFYRDGGESRLTRPGRGDGWRTNQFVPAVAYLQAQRIRGIMMRRFADALGDFDVWVAPYGDSRRRLAEPPPETPSGAGRGGGGGDRPRRSAQSRLFQLANHATYPAVALRHGFGADGLPTGMIFLGKPFSESKILRLAKAYQDSTDFHLRKPELRA